MTKMELSLGEGEPVNDLVGCERWEADSLGSDRNGGAVARAALDLRASSRRRSNSSCSDIIRCRGHQ